VCQQTAVSLHHLRTPRGTRTSPAGGCTARTQLTSLFLPLAALLLLLRLLLMLLLRLLLMLLLLMLLLLLLPLFRRLRRLALLVFPTAAVTPLCLLRLRLLQLLHQPRHDLRHSARVWDLE
jgi:hypothetical protein